MNKLLFDFGRNQQSATRNPHDLFADSLVEQYERLHQRYALSLPDDLHEFINIALLAEQYVFVWPSFDKSPFGEKPILKYQNICVIPYLPQLAFRKFCERHSICFFCDIQVNEEKLHFNKLIVKGITIIDRQDSNIPNSITLRAKASYGFDGNAPSISSSDTNALSPDFIKLLIDKCYPTNVSDVLEAKRYLDKWSEYIKFRKEYIDFIAEKCVRLNTAEIVDAYSTDGRHFNTDKDLLADYFIQTSKHTKDQVTSSEAVYLEEGVPSRSSFQHAPLIKLAKDFNQKDFLSKIPTDKDGQKKGKNPEEQLLLNIIRSDCRLTQQRIEPKVLPKNALNLGDLVGWYKEVVEPTETIHEIEMNGRERLDNEKARIDGEYRNLIEKETGVACDAYEKDLREEANKSLADFSASLVLPEELSDEKRAKALADKEKKIEAFKKKEDKKIEKDLNNFRSDKMRSLQSKYSEEINRRKSQYSSQIAEEVEKQITLAKEEQNLIRFTIYFRPEKEINDVKTDDLTGKIQKYLFLSHNDSGERGILVREEEALANLKQGYVMNPFLPYYLFSADKLPNGEASNLGGVYFLPSLNDLQKKAVNEALDSNGLFLLQGPPGTGKTQVIAEVIAHLVSEGKKVLISSETHKAIDNVFDRLPKIPEIIPVRLIPGTSKKHSEYSFENIVPNFYRNIFTHMDEASERYKTIQELHDNFEEQMKSLKMMEARISNLREKIRSLEIQIRNQTERINLKNERISSLRDDLRNLQEDRSSYSNAYRLILSGTSQDLESPVASEFLKEWNSKTAEFDNALSDRSLGGASLIGRTSKAKIVEEMEILSSGAEEINLGLRRNEIKRRMTALLDFDSNPPTPYPESKAEYDELQKELIFIRNKLLSSDFGNMSVAPICGKLFKPEFIKNNSGKIPGLFEKLQSVYHESLAETEAYKDKKVQELDIEIGKKQFEIDSLRQEIETLKKSNQALQKDETYQDYTTSDAAIKNKIQKFFTQFGIDRKFGSVAEALEIIQSKWDEIRTDFETNGEQLKSRLPFYREVSSYLKNPDVIEQDRENYTAALLKYANVIGLTCTTSKNVILAGANNKTYGIEKVDIKKLQIDVVIIDEVSKSSFIDLLIPILYGKTVILVGDHRQLPPMYDLAKMRDKDFEDIDPAIITPEKNKEYCRLVEDCYFKRLFNKVQPSRKIMLEQQYRCHSQIMDVFNHFYSGRLKMGFANQDAMKQHNMSISIRGVPVFTPDNHILFVDCKEGLEQRNENSTSISNPKEADVVVELVHQINEYFLEHKDLDKPSLGVISTYGLQARTIQRALSRDKSLKNPQGLKNTDEERFIVSTVDDFQGDERDIIILSMVRHPRDYDKSNPGFINAYQRINVALSRARKMLVIVGNRDYLEKKGIIDLPSLDGNPMNDLRAYPIYTKIIEETFRNEGRILTDSDILDEEEA